MWVGGLGKHIDDVLSASQCLSIKWNDSSFHFQYSFLLICWDKRKAGVYRACQPQCQCIRVSPPSCDLRCVIVLKSEPPGEPSGSFMASFQLHSFFKLQTNPLVSPDGRWRIWSLCFWWRSGKLTLKGSCVVGAIVAVILEIYATGEFPSSAILTM